MILGLHTVESVNLKLLKIKIMFIFYKIFVSVITLKESYIVFTDLKCGGPNEKHESVQKCTQNIRNLKRRINKVFCYRILHTGDPVWFMQISEGTAAVCGVFKITAAS